MDVTWEVVRNAASQAPSQISWHRIYILFYKIPKWFVSTLHFENHCSKNQSPRQRLKLWFHLKVEAGQLRIKEKGLVRQGKLQSSAIHAGRLVRMNLEKAQQCRQQVCLLGLGGCFSRDFARKTHSHLAPSRLLLSADWESHQWEVPPLHFWVTVSKSQSGGVGADEERAKEGSSEGLLWRHTKLLCQNNGYGKFHPVRP